MTIMTTLTILFYIYIDLIIKEIVYMYRIDSENIQPL